MQNAYSKKRKKFIAYIKIFLHYVSVDRDIEKLITLQEKDAIVANVKRKLSEFPKKISAKQSGISAVKQQLKDSSLALQELEEKRAEMRKHRRELEEKAIKYKAQLPTIRKNEDYIALNAEIDRIIKTASEIEEEEIGVLFNIDAKKDTLSEVEYAAKKQIEAIQEEIDTLNLEVLSVQNELAIAEDIARKARECVDNPVFLSAYDRVVSAKIFAPAVVKVDKGLCTGCYLKISGDIADALKSPQSPVFCEQCGRILYH